MSTSLCISAHIGLAPVIGERDENDRLKDWKNVKRVRVLNEDTNHSVVFRNVSEIVCPLVDIQLFYDGTRDWVLKALSWSPGDEENYITQEDMDVLVGLCKMIAEGDITDYRSFMQSLEGTPDVECDPDEDGKLFAGVCQTADEILYHLDEDNLAHADWIQIGIY